MKRSIRKRPPSAGEPGPVLIILTTVGTEEQALTIAHDLVGKHVAACVNIIPRIRSVFFWKGKVNDDGEWMLVVKTAPGNFEKVKDAIKRLNAYELPEILGVFADRAGALSAKWVVDASTPRKPAAKRRSRKA